MSTSLLGIAGFYDALIAYTVLLVQAIKIDPYLNIDAGTLGPLEYVDSRDAASASPLLTAAIKAR